jgi:hypothetical protein
MGEAACVSCRVLPVEENEDALNIFLLTKSQFIMGFGGPVDINHLAIWKAMEHYPGGIRSQWKCFKKVLRLSNWWLERIKPNEGN